MEVLSKIIAAMKHCRSTDDGYGCNECPMKDDDDRPCSHKGEGVVLEFLERYCDDCCFGVVRWCDEDIEDALRGANFDVCDENVAIIRKECKSHWFTDGMIETGWHYINCYIQENKDKLKRKE